VAEGNPEQSFIKPFKYRIVPSIYPMIAAWYEDNEQIISDFIETFRMFKGLLNGGVVTPKTESIPKHIGNYVDKYRAASTTQREKDILEILEDLSIYGRFLREVKIQAGCPGGPFPDKMRSSIKELVSTHLPLIQPAAVVKSFKCAFKNDGLHIDGLDEPVKSKSLGRFFKTRLMREEDDEYATFEEETDAFAGPDRCWLFAATIGPGIDDRVEDYLDSGDTYEALMLNSIGAAAADMTAVDMEFYLNKDISPEQGRLRRYHVGYGDFHLKWQKQLFKIIDPHQIGIKLNDSNIMLPEKSVSGIIALKKPLP